MYYHFRWNRWLWRLRKTNTHERSSQNHYVIIEWLRMAELILRYQSTRSAAHSKMSYMRVSVSTNLNTFVMMHLHLLYVCMSVFILSFIQLRIWTLKSPVNNRLIKIINTISFLSLSLTFFHSVSIYQTIYSISLDKKRVTIQHALSAAVTFLLLTSITLQIFFSYQQRFNCISGGKNAYTVFGVFLALPTSTLFELLSVELKPTPPLTSNIKMWNGKTKMKH